MDFTDIFILATKPTMLPAAVLANSLQRRASLPVRASVISDSAIPAPKSDSRDVLREIAEAKRYRGVAIVLTATSLAFSDASPLLAAEFGDRMVLVPERDGTIGRIPGEGADTGPDGIEPIAALQCDHVSWGESVGSAKDRTGFGLPSAWAAAGGSPNTVKALQYFADPALWPWITAEHMSGTAWIIELRFMLDQGVMGWHQMRELAEEGAVRPSLVDELRHMPHLNGFSQKAAKAFAERDAAAGFKAS